MILLNMQIKSNYINSINNQAHHFYNNRTKQISEKHVYKCRNVIRKTNNKFPRGQAFLRLLYIYISTMRPNSIPVSDEFNNYLNERINNE